MNIIPPIIHLNGSSAESLNKEYNEARQAASAAYDAARQIHFHQRDYYVNPDPEAWSKALAEHQKHISALAAARDYFEAIQVAIMEAGKL